MTGEPPPPMPARVSAWSVYDVFTLADGEQLFIGAVSDKQFLTLCHVLERAGPRRRPGARDQRAARRGAARAAGAARRDPAAPPHRRARRPSSKRPAFPTRRSCGPSSCSTTRTCGKRRPGADADRRRRHDRRRAAAAALGGRRPGVRRPLPRVGEHTEEVLARPSRQRRRKHRAKEHMALYRIDDKAPAGRRPRPTSPPRRR